MNRSARGLAAATLAAVMGASPLAAHSEPSETAEIKLGYVELADDARYTNRGEHSGIVFTDLGRPYQGSQVALEDARAIGRVIGIEFSIERATAKSVDELLQRISDWMESDGVHFVLVDLPAVALKDLAHRLTDTRVVLFNISAPEDSLRGE